MSIIQVDVQLTPQDLMSAAEQLKTEELDQLVDTMLALKAKRHTHVLTAKETELLTKINSGLDEETQQIYAALIVKRQTEQLSSEEYDILLKITQQVEALNAQRFGYLKELAELRQVSLPQLIEILGLDSPTYV